jgi:hypothetical protein
MLPWTEYISTSVILAQAGILKHIALRFPIKLGMTIPRNLSITQSPKQLPDPVLHYLKLY